jgi:hypothetical protein
MDYAYNRARDNLPSPEIYLIGVARTRPRDASCRDTRSPRQPPERPEFAR